ncbi:thioredoxin domain-containing protein 16-like [Hydractinia symbiolongicarpus]|uniref:thioredoxin domain-containing protein 16-like n=1 Tax=Hydractinia symbiolongicarpus TaxID=13093 RepID=UPI00254D61A4|nr:thioredoxin domain-containing protein 16-like [Hydractinia symbiolongicarpus]
MICLILIKIILLFSAFVSTKRIYKTGQVIKMVNDKNELDHLKRLQNGSLILYSMTSGEAAEKFEENLLRAHNYVSKYGFKMKKVNCNKMKRTIKECKHVTNQLVYLYKLGDEKIMSSDQLNGTKRTINEILFFLASSNYEKMIYVGSMAQANEIIEMNRKIFNSVVGCFQDYESEELRNFLDAAMEIGHDYAFLLLNGKADDVKPIKKPGYFITLYYTMEVEPGKQPETVDLTPYASNVISLKEIIQTLEMTEEIKQQLHKVKTAKSRQQEELNYQKEKAAEELERKKRKHSESNLPTPSIRRINTTDLLHKKGNKTNSFIELLSDEDSDLAKDAYAIIRNEHRNQKLSCGVNETEFYKELKLVNTTSKHVLLVLYYVSWDSLYQLFKHTYMEIADEVDQDVKAVAIDCSAWPSPCQQNQISTYPSLILYKPGLEPIRYKDFLHKQTLMKHISIWKEPFLPELSDVRQLQDLQKQMKETFVIAAFSNVKGVKQSESYKIYSQVALRYYGKVRMAVLLSKNKNITFNQQKLNLPSVVTVNANGVRNRIVRTNVFDAKLLDDWINEQTQPQVQELTPISFPKLLRLRKPFLIAFRERNKDRAVLSRFAQNNPNVITVWMDIDSDLTKSIQTTYNLQHRNTIALLDKRKNTVYEFKEGKRTKDNISKWISKCLSGVSYEPSYTLPDQTWTGNNGIDFLKLIDEEQKNFTSPSTKQENNEKTVKDRLNGHIAIDRPEEFDKTATDRLEDEGDKDNFRYYDEL